LDSVAGSPSRIDARAQDESEARGRRGAIGVCGNIPDVAPNGRPGYSRRFRIGAFLGVLSALVAFLALGVTMLRYLFDGWGT
jgi:hypothetical protein